MASEVKEMLWRVQSQITAVRGDIFHSQTKEDLFAKIHTANILLRQFERVHKNLRAEYCQWDRLAGDDKTWISSRLTGGMGASAVPEGVIQQFATMRLSVAQAESKARERGSAQGRAQASCPRAGCRPDAPAVEDRRRSSRMNLGIGTGTGGSARMHRSTSMIISSMPSGQGKNHGWIKGEDRHKVVQRAAQSEVQRAAQSEAQSDPHSEAHQSDPQGEPLREAQSEPLS